MGIRPIWPDFFVGYFRRAVMDDNGVRIKESHARDIHLVINHGEELPYAENQVEFMRGTSFHIDDIKEPETGCYVVYCYELA